MSDITPADPPQRAQIALVSAIKEEIAPLVRGWKFGEIEHDGQRFRFFEGGDGEIGKVVAICSGIGAEQGRRATEAVIQQAHPAKMISVGFAGALNSSLKVGDIVEPRVVVNSADGSRTDTGRGKGTVVSSLTVVGPRSEAAAGERLRGGRGRYGRGVGGHGSAGSRTGICRVEVDFR